LLARIRKLLLVLTGAALMAGVVLCVLAYAAIRRLGPDEINRRITAAVKAETGLDLISARLSTRVSYHVVITLDSARLMDGNQTVASFGRIRLTCGYRTLLFHGGLPFLAVSLDKPQVVLPVHSVTPGPMPVLDAVAVQNLRRILVRLSNVTRQLVMSTATVEDHDRQVLFEQAAVRATHSRAAGAWRVRLEGLFKGVALPSFKIGASLTMAPEIDGADVPFARGALWFWDSQLEQMATTGVDLRGDVQGNLTFLVRADGTVRGQALTRASNFQLGAPFIADPIRLSELTVSARLIHSVSGLQVTQFAIATAGQQLLAGSAQLAPLPPDNLRIRALLSPLIIDAEELKSLTRRIRGLPGWVTAGAAILTAGRLSVEQVNLDTTLDELLAPPGRILLHQAMLKASLDGIALTPPGQLPPVAELDGKLEYGGGLVRLTQGRASLGASTLNQISLTGDLGRAGAGMPYQVKVSGDLDVGQLYDALRRWMPGVVAEPLKRIQSVRGMTAAEIELHGILTRSGIADAPEYRAVLQPRGVTVVAASTPSEFKLYGGRVDLSPNAILIDKLDLAPNRGSLRVSGRIEKTGPGVYELSDLDLQMRQIDAEEWLPQMIAMDTMDVHAPASGTLSVSRLREGTHRYQVQGNLALGPGQIKFAFLRAPVVLTQPASVTLSGQGGRLAIQSATLEGSPLVMTLSVADVSKPVIRIDASAQKLDLEAITAVRLPWTPKTPVKIDNTSFEGHIEAAQANLERLQMRGLKASFRRDAENWRVFDISADALGGHLTMELTGRRRDDWVHIITRADDLDVAALQALGSDPTVVTGRLSSDADVWADTDDDFFNTLTGSLALTVKDGVLLKFKLLSRMLSLVDVSEWINANVPDPRVKGVPFKTISAHFTGEQGSFETNDFLLDGPVMKITAAGKVDVARSGMNMMIGMRPFQLLDTVFNKIPLIGSRIAASQSGIVAAYFHVHGPVGDPTVVPAPITSISHLLIKTLAIPINLVVPETVK
jgi:hypothetical protein